MRVVLFQLVHGMLFAYFDNFDGVFHARFLRRRQIGFF